MTSSVISCEHLISVACQQKPDGNIMFMQSLVQDLRQISEGTSQQGVQGRTRLWYARVEPSKQDFFFFSPNFMPETESWHKRVERDFI